MTSKVREMAAIEVNHMLMDGRPPSALNFNALALLGGLHSLVSNPFTWQGITAMVGRYPPATVILRWSITNTPDFPHFGEMLHMKTD